MFTRKEPSLFLLSLRLCVHIPSIRFQWNELLEGERLASTNSKGEGANNKKKKKTKQTTRSFLHTHTTMSKKSGARGGRTDLNKYSSETRNTVDHIHKIFPTWAKEDILRALEEHRFDVDAVLDQKLNGREEWTEVKKKKVCARPHSDVYLYLIIPMIIYINNIFL